MHSTSKRGILYGEKSLFDFPSGPSREVPRKPPHKDGESPVTLRKVMAEASCPLINSSRPNGEVVSQSVIPDTKFLLYPIF
jgi:hypothetical protein